MSAGMRTASPIPPARPCCARERRGPSRSPTFKTSMRTLSWPLAIARRSTARSPSGIARLVQTVAPSAAMTEISLTGETANEASFMAARSVWRTCARRAARDSSSTAITAVQPHIDEHDHAPRRDVQIGRDLPLDICPEPRARRTPAFLPAQAPHYRGQFAVLRRGHGRSPDRSVTAGVSRLNRPNVRPRASAPRNLMSTLHG